MPRRHRRGGSPAARRPDEDGYLGIREIQRDTIKARFEYPDGREHPIFTIRPTGELTPAEGT